jgi:hypothetical protein
MMCKKIIATFLAFTLILVGFTSQVSAAVIGTQQALSMEHRGTYITGIQSRLASDELKHAMIKLGVDPEQAALRVTALSDQELVQLNDQLENLPAGGGGALALIGAVFLVLVILEFTGVIDIFKKN